MSLIPVEYTTDDRGRKVVTYVDTDCMSDDDYAEYCRLSKLHEKERKLRYYYAMQEILRKY